MGSRIHVGDVLEWTAQTPGLGGHLVLKSGDIAVATFERVHRIGEVVAEGGFLGEPWRIAQRGLIPMKHVLSWLSRDSVVRSEQTFDISGNDLQPEGGPRFTYEHASLDATGGWRRADGALVVEWTQHEAALRRFRITEAGAHEPLLADLIVVGPHFDVLQARRSYTQDRGIDAATGLVVDALTDLLDR